MADTIKIGGELESMATGNKVADVANIKDKTQNDKSQAEINAEAAAAIEAETRRATEAENNRYTKEETYSKGELNNLITTPNQKYVTVTSYASLPVTGEADTVYRVSNYDGSQSQVDATKYSEYAWNGSGYVLLSVKTQIGEVFDISEYHSGAVYAGLSDALGTNGANVPATIRKGGMSVKFKQLTTPAEYSVDKTEGLDEQPTGTELLADPGIDDGTYNASQLSAFATLPTSTGVGNAVTYWMAVSGDSITYTKWVVTLVHTSDNKYVQYRYMSSSTAVADFTNVANWQGVDDEPTDGSNNLVESGGVFGEVIKIGTKLTAPILPITRTRVVTDVGYGELYSFGVIHINTSATMSRNVLLYSGLLRKGTVVKFSCNILDLGYKTGTWGFLAQDPSEIVNFEGIQLLNYGSLNPTSIGESIEKYIRVPFDGYMFLYYNNRYSTITSWGYYLDEYDDTPTENSPKPITSGGVYSSISNIENEINSLESDIEAVGTPEREETLDVEVSVGSYYSNNNGVFTIVGSKYSCYAEKIDLSSYIGCKLTLAIENPENNTVRISGIGDVDGNIIVSLQERDFYRGGTIERVVEEGDYLYYSSINYGRPQVVITIPSSNLFGDVDKLQEDVDRLLPLLPSELDTLSVPTIYDRMIKLSGSSNVSGILKNNLLYAEGFYKGERGIKVTIDGGKSVNIGQQGGPADFQATVNVKSEDGKVGSVIVRRHDVDASSVSGKAFVLCIGESTTDSEVYKPVKNDYNGKVRSDYWGYPSAITKYSMIDRLHEVGKQVITIGTHGNKSRTFSYGGQNYIIKSFHEGYSGHPAIALLNFPCHARLGDGTNKFGALNMWYALGLATKTPYNQSEYNVDREEYAGTSEQISLITQTPFAKYKMDGVESLWDLLKAIGGTDGFPVFSGTGNYTGSSEQLELMQSWAVELANNPILPFYDIDEARTGQSGTAFSLAKYLERYRTMDDAGNRLVGSAGETVVGEDGNTYTIGTRVTNTSSYDVCTPTHVILNIGINDAADISEPANLVANIKSFVNRFSIPTAYFITRHPGVSCVGQWASEAYSFPYVANPFLIDAVELLYPWFEEQQTKDLLPVYQIQYPASVNTEIYMYKNEIVDDDKILAATKSNVHPGWFAYGTIGWLCLNWVYAKI